jgi:acyl-coenzyme A thioesterase PaaI-like protein
LEGYREILHGGMICSVLDAAMTNCAFAAGVTAMTCDLYVRFVRPVTARGQARVRAWIEESRHPLYHMQARLQQEGELKATAKARFVEKNAAAALRHPVVHAPS